MQYSLSECLQEVTSRQSVAFCLPQTPPLVQREYIRPQAETYRGAQTHNQEEGEAGVSFSGRGHNTDLQWTDFEQKTKLMLSQLCEGFPEKAAYLLACT